MAAQGSLFLKSNSLLAMYEAVSGYQTTVQDALYEQYKSAYTISLTNHMRGNAADAFKTYFSQGTINMIQGMLDITSEMSMILQQITEAFYQFEENPAGQINEGRLDEIGKTLTSHQTTFSGMCSELEAALSAASSYISVTPIKCDEVDESYGKVAEKIQSIRDDMYGIDDASLQAATELLERINALKEQIDKTMGHCYKDGTLDTVNASSLASQDWYEKQTNATLALMLTEDPFTYYAESVTVSEDQWAAGLCSDVYAYCGYSIMDSGTVESGRDGYKYFLNAKASVLRLNGYAQFTDMVKAEAEVKAGYLEGEANFGCGDGYFGFDLEGGIGALEGTAGIVIGTENFNGYAKSEGKVLCADGKVAFEFEEDGQYQIGVKGGATAASASGEMGIGLFGYKVYDGTATGKEKDDLFKIEVGAEVNMGGSFAVYSESKTAIKTKFFNINATSIELEGSFIAGGKVSITVPTLYLKWPW